MITIDTTKKYALAVSGGVDSMVMLHAFANHLPRPNFFVVTVNHNIRKEGASDCEFVQNYCQKLGVECQTFSVDVPTYARQNKLSVETAARILRYQVFEKIPCDYLCLAHHQRDNVETVLQHIIRGSGANGAQGIRQINGKYFRPLLEVAKEQILFYAQTNNVPFVDDQTNADENYTRNYIRNQVLPMLQKICPNVEQNVARFAQNIAQDEAHLCQLADISTVEFDDNQAKIPVGLLTQPQPIAYRVLKKVFDALQIYHDVESCHYQAICQLAQNVGGKQISLPFDMVAINDYHFVTICKSADNAKADSWSVPFAVGVTQTPLGVVEVSATPLPNSLRFDGSKIPSDAVFRARQSGDVFCKFGGGTKSLKEYLIDKKIPQRNRDQLILVASGKDVLIICGVEIAQSVKDVGTSTLYITIR